MDSTYGRRTLYMNLTQNKLKKQWINGERNKLYQTDNVLARVLLIGSINCCFFPLIVLVESKKKKEYLQTYPLNCL